MVRQKKFIAYYRVSTAKQGRSGLGLQAQKDAVASFIAERGGRLLSSYEEQESGKRNDRPALQEALEAAKLSGATVCIAKLDRLSRNASFLLNLLEAGVDIAAADMPDADRLRFTIMAGIAEWERDRISERTKQALAAARKRGKRLGNAKGVDTFGDRGRAKGTRNGIEAIQAKADATAKSFERIFASLKREGFQSAKGMAEELNRRGMLSPRGKEWSPMAVIRTQERLATMTA